MAHRLPRRLRSTQGLEYLKNIWEGSRERSYIYGEKRKQKYVAIMRISNVQLDVTLDMVYVLLGRFATYDTDVEIKIVQEKQNTILLM